MMHVPPSERERAARAVLRSAMVDLVACADALVHDRGSPEAIDGVVLKLGRAYERLRHVPSQARGRDVARALADALFTCLTAIRSGLLVTDMRAHVRMHLGAARAWLEVRM